MSKSLPVLIFILVFSVQPLAAARRPAFASSFEQEPFSREWQRQVGGPKLVGQWDTRRAHKGTRSFVLQAGGIETKAAFTLKPQAIYRVQFSTKSEQSGKQGFWHVQFFDSTKREFTCKRVSSFTATTEWQVHEAYFMACEGTVNARFAIGTNDKRPNTKDVRMFVDAISISPATEGQALAWMKKVQIQLPIMKFKPSPTRHKQIPETMKRLVQGGKLRIVMIGDEACTDIGDSLFHLLLKKRFPRAEITLVNAQKDGKGALYFRTPGPFTRQVKMKKPDLLIIAGVSHTYNAGAIRQIIATAKAEFPKMEALVMSGAVQEPGMTRFMNARGIRKVTPAQRQAAEKRFAVFRKQLQEGSGKEKFEFWDLRTAWEDYVKGANGGRDTFMRDGSHANELGKQALGRLLEAYMEPPKPK